MLTCEGYKMFLGSAKFVPQNPQYPSRVYHGRWLFKPDNNYWYLNGCPDYPFGTSFPANQIEIVEDES